MANQSKPPLKLVVSGCTGFRITSDIVVTTGVVFGPQQACNTPAQGCMNYITQIELLKWSKKDVNQPK